MNEFRFITMIKAALFFLISMVLFSPAIAEEKYEWRPYSNCPKGYPAEFVYAYVYYGEDESIYVPPIGASHIPWGSYGSVHVVGPDFKALPHTVSLAWMSFVEDKFYEAEFSLPQDKIRELFQKEGPNPRGIEDGGSRGIIVGVAPGGVVSVWVATDTKFVEVANVIAEEADFTMEQFVPTTTLGRKEYVQSTVDSYIESHPDFAYVTQEPITDYWSDLYRRRYDWKQVFDLPDGAELTSLQIEYYNGEMQYVDGNADTFQEAVSQAVPRYLRAKWYVGDRQFGIRVTFNELEILRAFDYVFEDSTVISAEFIIAPNYDEKQLTISVRSGDRVAYLAKPKARVYEIKD